MSEEEALAAAEAMEGEAVAALAEAAAAAAASASARTDGEPHGAGAEGQALAAGRRGSGGSMSTLEASDWEGEGAPSSYGPAGSSPSAAPLQQVLGMAALLPCGAGPPLPLPSAQQARGRRNARQQEQNKQAQQRYRAKRKAQFEELQRKVAALGDDAAAAQRLRAENAGLRRELEQLRVGLTAAAERLAPSGTSPGGLASLAAKPEPQSGDAAQPQQPQPQPLPAGAPGQGSAFRPPPARPAPPAAAHVPAPATPAGGGGGPPQLSGSQIQAALSLFYADLQAFAAAVALEATPLDGSGLGTEASTKLGQLVAAGIELVRMTLGAAGPDAATLLTAGAAAVGPEGVSPADSLAQWRLVALRLALTPDQRRQLADWRRRFLQKIDDCYGRRLLHKAQLTQLPGTALGGQTQQWVEALLLQAAETVGYSACALSCAQLDGVVAALGENLREERATAAGMMAELLGRILTRVQAARFLLAGHPFCWNGLSFAHAVAALDGPAPAPAQPVQQPAAAPMAQLLARHA